MTENSNDSANSMARFLATDGSVHVGRILPRCQLCHESYSFPGTTSRFNQHLPVLLSCGHVICEMCLWQAKSRHFVKCPTCNNHIALNLKRKTSDQFEFNFYVFGLIKHITTFGDKDEPSSASGTDVPNCGECSNPVADRRCIQCDSLYCQECFKKIHHFSNVLRTHQTLELGLRTKFHHTPTLCDMHPGEQVNFYCETCDKAICLECKTHYHLIHMVSQLFQRNAKAQKDIHGYISLLQQLQELNKMSIETSNSALHTEKAFAQKTIDEISNHFIELHGSLQLLEMQLVNKVKDRFTEDLRKIEFVQEKLRSNKDQIDLNLEKLNYYNRNTPYNVDLESILRNLSAFAKELPCDLNVFQSSHNPFTFERPTPPIDLSNGFCLKWEEGVTLNVKPCHNISLPEPQPVASTSKTPPVTELMKARRNLPERRCHRSNKSKDRRSSKKTQAEREQLDHSSSSQDRNRDMDQPKEKKHRRHSSKPKKSRREENVERSKSRCRTMQQQKISVLPKIESESVRVSHIKSPHAIYTQNLTFVANIENFFEMCANVAHQQVKPEEILPGQMYLLQDTSDTSLVKRWYRAVVKSEKDRMYDVLLVDFGNVRKVTKGQMLTCPDVLKEQPLGAIHCSLYNLQSMKGKWTDEVNCMLSELIMSDSITKMTLGMQGEVHVVDLIVMKNFTPVSIRDNLISVGLAREIHCADSQMSNLIADLKKFIQRAYSASPKFYTQTVTVGGYFSPKVTHVESPMEFYVMKTMDIPVYEEQTKAMDKYYHDLQKERVYSPKVGVPVAINYRDHWHRAEVTAIVGTLQVEVVLVDQGFKQTVNQRSLRALHSDFMKLSKGVIACNLVHVDPCEHNGSKWSHEALETFRALTNTDNLELFVHSVNNSLRDFFNVTLYSVRRDKIISINAQLVQLEFATSTGTESVQVEFHKDFDDESDDGHVTEGSKSGDKAKKKSFRKNAKIMNIISPGEFYVVFLEHISGIEHVQRKIQQQMFDYVEPSQLPDWRVNDVCFARTQTADDPIMEWRRAVVKRCHKSMQEYDVFLLDSGVEVCIEKEDMAEITEKSWDSCPGAIRCHLSHIKPTSGNSGWPASAVEKMRSYCKSKKFEGYAVTMVGTFINSSAPVILWGRIEEDDPLQPTIVRWKNLNECLVNRGYAELTEKFPETFDNNTFVMELMLRNEEFEKFLEGLNDSPKNARAKKDPLEDQVSPQITMVTEWKPADPWSEMIFTGVATYVDNNGIIYMYLHTSRKRLDNMRNIAASVLNETLPSPVEQFWAKNQPCMAKYHLDSNFYRGIVRRVDKEKSQCLVQFVDYGNIEECAFKDMRKNLLFGKIPIQSYRFKLSNILPFVKDKPWPCDVLDKMHAYTVGHDCAVTLAGPPEAVSITPGPRVYDIVSLRMGEFELVNYLVQNEMAVYSRDDDVLIKHTALECLSPADNKGKKQSATAQPKQPDLNKLNSISDFQEYFKSVDQTIEIDAIEDEGSEQSDLTDHDTSSDFSDDLMVETVKKKSPSETSLETFNPMYASTKVREEVPHIFTCLTLKDDCVGFYGTTTELMSPLDLYFFPEIEEHVTMHKFLDDRLQESAVYCQSVSKVSAATAYVAQYSDDMRWYRAIVDSEKIIEDEVQVKFIDYLNTEMVKMSKVRPLHPSLQTIALRNIHLRLADVTLNPRYRPEDIEQELRKLLHQKRIYVKIVQKRSQETPHMVQLFADKDDEKVIYEILIANKFFLRRGMK